MLLELNLAIRLALLVLLSLLTIWCSLRGLQNAILLLLVTSLLPMYHSMLISGGWLPHLTLERIVWPLMFLIFMLQWMWRRTYRCTLNGVEYSMLVLLVVIILNMYFHETYIGKVRIVGKVQGDKLQLYGVLSGFFLPFMSYFIMRRGVLTEAQAKSFLTGVGVITVYLGLTGLGEAWHQSWLVFPKYILDPGQGIHFGKVRGPFIQASWNGLAMAMGLPILLWLFFRRRDASRWLWLAGIAAVGLSLPYIFQRAAWLSAAVALGASALTSAKRGPSILGALVLVMAVGGLLAPATLERAIQGKLQESENIDYRYELLKTSVAIIDSHLLTGVGFYRFQEEILGHNLSRGYSSHNTAITLFAELGLVGFLPYLLIFGFLFFKSAKAYWQLPSSRAIIGLLWGITGAYWIMLISVELRGVLYVHVLLFALWGMLLEMICRQAILYQERRAAYQRVSNFI